MFRTLDETISVAGQVTPDQVAEAARLGFRTLVNNRPDGEQPGQPTGEEIGQAATAAGLDYLAIPVSPAGLREDQVAAMTEALKHRPGPVLAFCRSGTRSTYLWALARARLGDDADVLVEKAAAQGYDLSSLRPMLER